MSEQHDWNALREDIKPQKRRSVWLISFTDMITLILAFFILIFAMKELKSNKASKVITPLPGEVGTSYGGERHSGPDIQTGVENTPVLVQKVFALHYLEALFRKLLETDPLLSKVQYGRMANHLVLSLDFTALSDSRNEEAQKSLGVLVNTLARVQNKIEIMTIIENNEDWGRAAETSQHVARILKNSGYNRDILISVFGGSDYGSNYGNDYGGENRGRNPAFSEALQLGAVNILISE